MTDATPGQKAMASRIADETIPEDSDAYDTPEARMADWYVARDAALAAIIETTELAAKHAEGMPKYVTAADVAWDFRNGYHLKEPIRAGQHYGKDTDQ